MEPGSNVSQLQKGWGYRGRRKGGKVFEPGGPGYVDWCQKES